MTYLLQKSDNYMFSFMAILLKVAWVDRACFLQISLNTEDLACLQPFGVQIFGAAD